MNKQKIKLMISFIKSYLTHSFCKAVGEMILRAPQATNQAPKMDLTYLNSNRDKMLFRV